MTEEEEFKDSLEMFEEGGSDPRNRARNMLAPSNSSVVDMDDNRSIRTATLSEIDDKSVRDHPMSSQASIAHSVAHSVAHSIAHSEASTTISVAHSTAASVIEREREREAAAAAAAKADKQVYQVPQMTPDGRIFFADSETRSSSWALSFRPTTGASSLMPSANLSSSKLPMSDIARRRLSYTTGFRPPTTDPDDVAVARKVSIPLSLRSESSASSTPSTSTAALASGVSVKRKASAHSRTCSIAFGGTELEMFPPEKPVCLQNLYNLMTALCSDLHVFVKDNDLEQTHATASKLRALSFDLFVRSGFFHFMYSDRDEAQSAMVRTHFRHTFSQMSKLILMADSCLSYNKPRDYLDYLLKVGHSVKLHVQEFVTYCAGIAATLPAKVLPAFVENAVRGGEWSTNDSKNCSSRHQWSLLSSAYIASLSDLFFGFERMGNNLSDTMSIAGNNEDALVQPTIALLHSGHSILSHMETLDLGPFIHHASSHVRTMATDFLDCKQYCYNLLTDLFMKLQTCVHDSDTLSHQLTSLNNTFRSAVVTLNILEQERPTSLDPVIVERSSFQSSEDQPIDSLLMSPMEKCCSRDTDLSLTRFQHLRDSDASSPSLSSADTPRPGSSMDDDPMAQPWYLLDSNDGDLVYNRKNLIKAGTLEALIYFLVKHIRSRRTFTKVFFFTYPTFTSSIDLFRALRDLYLIPPPEGLSTSEYSVWISHRKKPLQENVCFALQEWLQKYFADDISPPVAARLFSEIRAFIIQMVQSTFPSAQEILKQLDELSVPDRNIVREQRLMVRPAKPNYRVALLELEPDTLAEQFSLIEHSIFCAILPHEFLKKSWRKSASDTQHHMIRHSIAFSNSFVYWIINSVLTRPNLEERIAALRFFIAFGIKCLNMNNFSAVVSVISALDSAPIYRLRSCFGALDASDKAHLQGLREIVDSRKNFKTYRTLLKRARPPCVPFLGVLLSDLTFIDDGMPDMLNDSQYFINFGKRHRQYEVIADIIWLQSTDYGFTPLPDLQAYMMKSFRNANQDVTSLYDLSLAVEPRQ
ncbi:exchange factor Cdc25p-like protein [Schizosaccharomyces japonicus yFS275]|uniref:Exchange factor Cdc25p-like protein n=1 Tax=Schizosaccharomyces japonicus (strain yFS275 / FY16936) TaxID=402676 RepID=B6K196_SCHJY|nr:exchange factor Cdc25p-like protein [Schizosaccharomyces japonicus yFS275]EEB07717.1 exchange factor Cdc25p-like protein [Schizosaccharomyces japonicus yFS275]